MAINMTRQRTLCTAFLLAILVWPLGAEAALVRGTLAGAVITISARDMNNQSDDASFQAILPFAIGAPVVATFQYDTETGYFGSGGWRDVAGTLSVAIAGVEFGAPDGPVSVSADDNSFGGGDRLIVSPPLFTAPSNLLPQGWGHAFVGTGSRGRQFRVGLVDVTGRTIAGASMPSRPLTLADFTYAEFSFFTSIDGGDGASIWTAPSGATYSGRDQSIYVSFSSASISPVTVPEPCSAWQAACLLAGLPFIRSKRA
jgi:hypothetical protein